jgi:hypothetical protein
MRLHHTARIVAVAVAAGVIAPVAATFVGSATNAYASGNQITCTSLKGNATTQTLSKCTGPSAILAGEKAGKGTATSAVVGAPSGSYQYGSQATWGKSGAGGTSTAGVNATITGPGKGTPCGKKDETVVETSTVVSGTGAAEALVGDSGTSTVCYDSTTNTVKLAKGSTVGA